MSLNDLAHQINKTAVDYGFWEVDRNFGEMLALIHSEISEALEEHRDKHPNVWYLHEKTCPLNTGTTFTNKCCNPKPEGVAVELVDALIRILDTLYSLNVDIDKVVAEKMQYNDSRPYKHGKDY